MTGKLVVVYGGDEVCVSKLEFGTEGSHVL